MLEQRKPALRRTDIPQDVLNALSSGAIPTANLVEWLALDQAVLLEKILGKLSLKPEGQALLQLIHSSTDLSVNGKMKTIGAWIGQHISKESLQTWSAHTSDMVRGWMAYAWIEKTKHQGFEIMLKHLKNLADDPHFSVREVAWMALRPCIIQDTESALNALLPWSHANETNLRRFACEATRPRGVWCAHLPLLREFPEKAENLLLPLRYDTEKYVQLSLGNWLNDAGKTRPDWVRQFVKQIDPNRLPSKIVLKRALRNLP